MEKGYTEFDLSQKPALDVLEKMGYTILKPEEAEVMRGSKCCHSLRCLAYPDQQDKRMGISR